MHRSRFVEPRRATRRRYVVLVTAILFASGLTGWLGNRVFVVSGTKATFSFVGSSVMAPQSPGTAAPATTTMPQP